MRKVFATTSNVRNFCTVLNRLQSRDDGVPGMALIYGEPGVGKTKTAIWWCAQNSGVFVRTKKLMNGRWLLEEIVAELGEAPMRRNSDLFRQVVDLQLEKPRTLIVDEVDYLAHDARVIETLRDIHDVTGAPVVLIGMGMADKKLRRFQHLWDRFCEVLKFHELTESDVKSVAEQMCEVKLSSDAVSYIRKQTDKFRGVLFWLYKAELAARAANVKEITAAHFEGGKK